MHIVKFASNNFKRLRAVEIEPDGSLVRITGKNGQGKTSVLDAIWSALGGKRAAPTRAVREGEEEARIFLNIDDRFMVERKFKPDGKSTITVSNQDGARYQSPQAILDGLVGELAFDPLAFATASPSEQVEQLKAVVPLGINLEELEGQESSFFNRRTDVARELKRLKLELEERDEALADQERPGEIPSTGELVGKLDNITKRNRNREELDRRIKSHQRAVDDLEASITAMRKELTDLEELREHAGAVEPMTAVQNELHGLDALHATKGRFKERDVLAERVEAAQSEWDGLDSSIKDLRRAKRQALADAKFPVEGLAFDQGNVVYNGLPFDQAADSEKLRVSMAVAMAANPKLRVLRVTDGSLLDSDSLKLVAELAAENDYQVWLESVDESGQVGIVIEDGAVVAVNAGEGV